MPDIERLLKENDEILNDLTFRIDVPEQDAEHELFRIIESVPSTVWEALGYKGVTEVYVSRPLFSFSHGYSIHITAGNNSTSLCGLTVLTPWKDLAAAYRPYRDFCIQQMKNEIDKLGQLKDFVVNDNATYISKYHILGILHRDNFPSNYHEYFHQWKLADPLVTYCMQNRISDPKKILYCKYRLVLDIFCRKLDFPDETAVFDVEGWDEYLKFFTAFYPLTDRKKFAKIANYFLMSEDTVENFKRKFEAEWNNIRKK